MLLFKDTNSFHQKCYVLLAQNVRYILLLKDTNCFVFECYLLYAQN